MTNNLKNKSFQSLILALQNFWADKGCVVLQPYDMEVGAGTFHVITSYSIHYTKLYELVLVAVMMKESKLLTRNNFV